MNLVIISHTAHYISPKGEILGWGSTVTEINHLVPTFDKIYHCAFLHNEYPPESSLPYKSSKIEFIPLPPSGGKGLQKLSLFTNLLTTINSVRRVLKMADVFQFRAPTGIGLYMIPYLTIFTKKKGWFKYAGNWIEQNPPLGYYLQRIMLKMQYRKVTINGAWPNQPKNILTFENPCLTLKDREKGLKTLENKSFKDGLNICFIGNLTSKKGFEVFMEALLNEENIWNEVHIVGDGPLAKHYKAQYPKAIFHGFLSKENVHDIYIKCHIVVLPSFSEGFPKVIAEGMNYGCIPIVSEVSGVNQIIINEENGFLINPINRDHLILVFKQVLNFTENEFRKMSEINYRLASRFTFNSYLKNIKARIL